MDLAALQTEFATGGSPDVTRRPASVGTIIAVTGSRAQILLERSLFSDDPAMNTSPYIGTLLAVDTGTAIVLCLITSMRVPSETLNRGEIEPRLAEVELVGELPRGPDGVLKNFQRGITVYPRLGDMVRRAGREELEKTYHVGKTDSVQIGSIHQDQNVPAMMKIDEMLGKHFAVVGSTGSGKSCTVAQILRQILAKHQNGRVLLLDPHNEYGSCFGDKAHVVQSRALSLPFWFLNFDETVEILLGEGRKLPSDIEILRDLIPAAKRQFAGHRRRASTLIVQNGDPARERFSVDVPTPYRISDLIGLIDEQMGRLEVQKDLSPYKRLKARIESISRDPRFAFMFGNLTVHDTLPDVLKSLFRIPVAGKPVTVVQLMGVPAEVLNVVVSVLARMAFDVALWSEGRVPLTFVCEEAHRYVPRDADAGFEPTKRAIARIAKEGRKYGISLSIVSQRPGDIDPTIVSQCSTLVTMRLASAHDQAIIHAAVTDANASLLDFLPTLGTREALVFGEGFTLPSRILISELPPEALPRGATPHFSEAWSEDIADENVLDGIIARLRMTDRRTEEAASVDETAIERAPRDPVTSGDPGAPGERPVPGFATTARASILRR